MLILDYVYVILIYNSMYVRNTENMLYEDVAIIICISCLCCVNVILRICYCNLWSYVRKEYGEYIVLRRYNNCLHWLCRCVCSDDFNLRANYHHHCIVKKMIF